MNSIYKVAIRLLGGYIIICIIFFILIKTVFMLSQIPSASMEGTIMVGDIVFSTRYGVSEEDLERYDILVFASPDAPNIECIKRLIGLPGETIEVRDGKVYADGVELDDSFLDSPQNRRWDLYCARGMLLFLGR